MFFFILHGFGSKTNNSGFKKKKNSIYFKDQLGHPAPNL